MVKREERKHGKYLQDSSTVFFVSSVNGLFNGHFLSFVFSSFPFTRHRHSECYTWYLVTLSGNAVTWICVLLARFAKNITSCTAPHCTALRPDRNGKPCSATEPNLQGSRDRWSSTCPRESATLSQSYSSPELPVSSDESFASSCSLHNACDDKQQSVAFAATLRSLFDSQVANTVVVADPSAAGHTEVVRGRKYRRSYSEVILHSSAETCGESKSD